jgi:ubiquinol-cytochrome c reductase iron-sulfur subunit
MQKLFTRLLTGVAVWRSWRARRQGEPLPPAPSGAETLPPGEDPSEREVPANPRAERAIAGLLFAAAVFGFGFTATYVLDGLNTQLLGVAIGCMFMLLAAAAIIAGKAVVPQETSVEERTPLLEEGAPEELFEITTAGGEGISRRLLLTGAVGLAGAAATTAALTPLASLGPNLKRIHHTPWHRGVPFVDEEGHPYLADEIEIGSFYTALPAGAYWEQLGAPLLVIRLPKHYLRLPPARARWAPRGILAFSKICPHAACAISLYRYPTFAPTSGVQPAFTCPCHYSTFLPGEGGRLLFGPAGRALPQLPVLIDSSGHLTAGGDFDEDVGPAWFHVRRPGST